MTILNTFPVISSIFIDEKTNEADINVKINEPFSALSGIDGESANAQLAIIEKSKNTNEYTK
ncbi:hypothetical protein JRB89_005171 [Salmonella enterica]|nr:hypothetical protein [Salmonella enterica]KRT29288.1 hypothetical protein LPMST01_04895 [Salmonella enterica subsp. enterica serovar Infantis]